MFCHCLLSINIPAPLVADEIRVKLLKLIVVPPVTLNMGADGDEIIVKSLPPSIVMGLLITFAAVNCILVC
jgi:hypothetical protein